MKIPFWSCIKSAPGLSRARQVLLVSAIDADAEQRGEDRLRENRKAKLANYPRQQLSCPVYSGPGFDFKYECCTLTLFNLVAWGIRGRSSVLPVSKKP